MVEIIEYSEKAIAVIGDTKPIKAELKDMGGRFNKWLKHPETGEHLMGWIFSKKKRDIVAAKLKGERVVRSMYDYLLLPENVREVAEVLLHQFSIKSVVMNDTTMLPDNGKRYLFLGSGCGFAWIKVRKGSRAEKEIWASNALMSQRAPVKYNYISSKYQEAVLDALHPGELEKIMECAEGHLGATFAQNLSLNRTIVNQQAEYIRKYLGNKKVRVYSRLD